MPSVTGTRVSTLKCPTPLREGGRVLEEHSSTGKHVCNLRRKEWKKEVKLKESIYSIYGRGTFRQMMNDSIEADMI